MFKMLYGYCNRTHLFIIKNTCKKLQLYSYRLPKLVCLASSKYYIMYTWTWAVFSELVWNTVVGLLISVHSRAKQRLASAGASRHVCVHGQAVSKVRPSILQLTPVREAEEPQQCGTSPFCSLYLLLILPSFSARKCQRDRWTKYWSHFLHLPSQASKWKVKSLIFALDWLSRVIVSHW